MKREGSDRVDETCRRDFVREEPKEDATKEVEASGDEGIFLGQRLI